MREGEIIFKGKTNKKREILVRYPTKEDAQEMCDYINELSKEKTFIAFQGEQTHLKDEIKWLNSRLKAMKKKNGLELLVFCDGKLIAESGIRMGEKIEKHVGILGLSVLKEFRNQGIGKVLMRLVLEEAEKNIPNLKILTLGIFEGNEIALEMYKKFGFIEYGELPKGILYKDRFISHLYMYKEIKR